MMFNCKRKWPQLTLIGSVTRVFYSHGILDSRAAAHAKEFLSALQKQCVTHYCELWINIQQSAIGLVETTVLTVLPVEEVYASLANASVTPLAFNAVVDSVMLQADTTTNGVMLTPSN